MPNLILKLNAPKEEALFGQFLVNFFHDCYMCSEPWTRTCANASEFHALRTLVEEEVTRQKLGYTGGGGGTWWASFSKLGEEGRYDETIELFKLRVKI